MLDKVRGTRSITSAGLAALWASKGQETMLQEEARPLVQVVKYGWKGNVKEKVSKMRYVSTL